MVSNDDIRQLLEFEAVQLVTLKQDLPNYQRFEKYVISSKHETYGNQS